MASYKNKVFIIITIVSKKKKKTTKWNQEVGNRTEQ